MNDQIEKGIAFMAAGHQPLDAEATMSVIGAFEAINRDPNKSPEEYKCAVSIENENGELRKGLLPLEVRDVALFMGHCKKQLNNQLSQDSEVLKNEQSIINEPGIGSFVDAIEQWFAECDERKLPVFIGEIEEHRIFFKLQRQSADSTGV